MGARNDRAVRRAAATAVFGVAATIGLCGFDQTARAALYWDVNGAMAGPGTPPNGAWSPVPDSFSWSGSPAGDTSTQPWPANEDAVFTAGSFAGGYLVIVTGPVLASSLRFEDGNATLNGAPVILTGAGGNIDVAFPATGRLNLSLGGTVGMTKIGIGTLTFGVAPGYSGATAVNAGTVVVDGEQFTNSSALSVAAGATFRMDTAFGATGVIKAASVSATTTGKINLTDNKLITDTAPGTESGGVYSGVQGLVQRASNGGAWNGGGITTSMSDAVNGLTSIGVATGEQVKGISGTQTATFSGQTVTANSTIAMYTYAGDANLDGQITGDDYSAIDFSILVPGSDGWVNGDFNYDGAVTGDDYSAIDFNILAQGAPFPTSPTSVTAVPEPAATFAAVAAATLLFVRRRRPARE